MEAVKVRSIENPKEMFTVVPSEQLDKIELELKEIKETLKTFEIQNAVNKAIKTLKRTFLVGVTTTAVALLTVAFAFIPLIVPAPV